MRVIQISVYACLLAKSSLAVAGDHLVVPRDLHDYSQTLECEPPADFYDHRFAVQPPYLYALIDSAEPAAAAFWCRAEGRSDQYSLIFRPGEGDIGRDDCPIRISRQGQPGGLSVVNSSTLDLDQFRGVSDVKNRIRREANVARRAIRSESDGTGTYFLCVDGEWFFWSYD